MSSIKLTADSGGGTVELKAPATTGSNAAKILTLPSDETGEIITSDRSGTTLQRKFVYLTSATDLTSAGAFHELTTDLRIAFTPKKADSTLMMEFYACFYCANSTHLQYAKFFDVTNNETPALPPAAGSRDRVHWVNRNGQTDANDADACNMRIFTAANNTTARTYTIYHRTEGVTVRFLRADGDAAALTTMPAVFNITEIAA